ncbi:2-oxoglutarate dehydrogenase complex dihydrolipoyllysine-residue succinyltransferase [Persicimonas caeni]|uniref:Dihydrolipoyllysine-residue succinyltransferase component of 2-oxoglutarate dehydrogenase complex n=1 Tax=Persicimonas caeni TaxID=2292766 RepID=A0A4Y6PRZ5_PERCE|nr:2-oxoglutarate dehydrogenase complex dihydrolipoyllysine-residue succinyltransferase [Persicimonas caeni]QDG50787.1 2-oxoglutarate dehydrogenase complex dihydrolipoyllysine-residue succinyltransferase [Persicimonas caeni]QED32008.1 2-oxoglutarate dehydrogenase complex dihydrolipoyllysine-residue succinyltransferase [Persicimonas caeni]
MSVTVEVPSLGESVTEGYVAEWKKKEGDYIAEDEVLVELETDKITITVPSPVSGTITALKADIDDAVAVGEVIAEIEPGEAPEGAGEAEETVEAEAETAEKAAEPVETHEGLSPAVARLVEEHNLDPSDIEGSGPDGRILKGDVLAHVEGGKAKKKPADAGVEVRRAPQVETQQTEERVKMSRLRQTIAKRLVSAQQDAAMLTTFQEADMSGVMELRKKYKQKFLDKYDVKLGFMSFFVKAAIEALKAYPAVNAEIDGNEIVYKNYYNIGVAVGGGEKGLVVPVIKNADQLSFAEVELTINELVGKVKSNSLTMEDLQGGTFSITNGGIYGSMLSTPILNPPQSGILGMHNIVERPVAVDGEVVIRPVMYLALSYDHRIIDGREAVSFLVRLKECIENPERILLEI